jgi:hypothetical protein
VAKQARVSIQNAVKKREFTILYGEDNDTKIQPFQIALGLL